MNKSGFLNYALLLLFVTALFSCTTSEVEWITAGDAAEHNMSPDSLEKIVPLIKELTDQGKIPGAVFLVARHGEVVFTGAAGYRNREAEESYTENSIFRIASMTKPVVSVAVMQLWEQGKLGLQDPVSDYVSSFAEPVVLQGFNAADTTWTSISANREITIHDLLTHTSGISYGFLNRSMSAIYAKNGVPDLATAEPVSIEQTMDALGKLPLAHHPGEKYTYGLSIDLLGRVVEVVSGMSLAEYITCNITGPLRMNDTRFFYYDDVSARLAKVYAWSAEDESVVPMPERPGSNPDYPVEGAKSYFSGGSGLSSTVSDYFVFSQMILKKGEYRGVRILKEETVELMTSNQHGELAQSPFSAMGYGFWVSREQNADGTPGAINALGWGGAFNTWFTINPAKEIVAVVMSQVLFNPYGGELESGFRDIVNSAVQIP
ncbi:MAG: beta-lactamase family protein [Bacteroidales bacterium]|nr:beta-lactamase family protein [Bacteroidales bacterium]